MKKFMLRRILPAMLALSVMVSLMVVPARAVITPGQALEYISQVLSAADTLNRITDEVDSFLLGTYSQSYGFCWCASDAGTAEWHVTEEELYRAREVANSWPGVDAEIINYKTNGLHAIQLKIAGMSNNRIILLADDAGSPLVWEGSDGYEMTPEERQEYTSARWIPAQNVTLRGSFITPVPLSRLKELAAENGGTVYKTTIKDENGTADLYYIIKNGGRYFLADSNQKVYTCETNRVANEPDKRPTGSIWVVNENGDLVEMEDTDLPDYVGVDLGSLIGNLPTDSNVIFNGCTYDESTKTYYYHTEVPITIDNRQYYYFTYNYHINYTSVTYIGTTEEYDKHYEVYYQLPDGRSSADLTAEELEQLNVSIDVINYGRSADDVSLRSLYHFDGDTDDASYWNYCTEFTWNKGASLTYMDEGTFEGSLYLDETEHDFTLTLPSGLSSLDFTLQFRYYQSATAAPQTDSYINLGSVTVLKLNGANIQNGSGTVLSAMPVGSWNELALIRESGILYYYLNGVSIGSVTNTVAFSNKITFHFGAEQQTFKKLDEFRILNSALQTGGASYTPTSVPHDTNLALVLPDSAKPVADEYWKFTSSGENLLPLPNGDELTLGYESSWGASFLPTSFGTGNFFSSAKSSDQYGDGLNYGSMEYLPGFLRITKFLDMRNRTSYSSNFHSCCRAYLSGGKYSSSVDTGKAGDYVFSVVTTDGTVYSAPFSLPVASTYSTAQQTIYDWGSLGVYKAYGDSDRDYCSYFLFIEPNTSIDIVYMELIRGTSTDLTAEKVTSITAMTPEDLTTPTLAVRSDIPVTSWQIGGVRPSVPTKGQVWALVERQYITSLQIYNGRAWEACDGRIWTGSRWVPYSAYNVITLKDMSDIVDGSSPDKEYIYTESGFWDWLQRFLTGFKTELFARLDRLKGGSGTDECKHSYQEEVVKEATCTDKGQLRRTCSLCDESLLENIPALGHDWTVAETTEDHYELPAGTVCPECGGSSVTFVADGSSCNCTCSNADCGHMWTVQGRLVYGQATYACSRCEKTRTVSNALGGFNFGGTYGNGDIGDSDSPTDVVASAASGFWAFVKGFFKLVGGVFGNAGEAISGMTDAADTTNPDGAFGFFLIPLEEEGG